jgi:hypothetical protein
VREYIVHYQIVDSELVQEMKVKAGTLQDAVDIFRDKVAMSQIKFVESDIMIRDSRYMCDND